MGAIAPVPAVKPVRVLVKFAKPCKAVNAQVKVTTRVHDVRIVTQDGKVVTVDLKGPMVTADTRADTNDAAHTVAE